MGKRGPPPKPTKLKEIACNPGRRALNKNEPCFSSLKILPPDFLDPIALEEWNRIGPELSQNGLLTIADRAVFAGYCQSYSRWVQAEQALQFLQKKNGGNSLLARSTSGTVVANPLVRIANDMMGLMIKFSKEFGMTPSSRTHISIEKSSEQNPFSKLIRQ